MTTWGALSVDRAVAAIDRHSSGLADAAQGNLQARVEHCPDWSVAELVRHVIDVHWFWSTIAGERLTEPPSEDRRPPSPDDAHLLEVLRAGARELTTTLRGADQDAACWTWYPRRQTVDFVTRHQVQEVVVHHWDAVNAAGGTLAIEPDVAWDSVEEFLTVSLADAEDAASRPRLAGELVLWAEDAAAGWVIGQREDGELVWDRADPGTRASVSGTSGDLLLWLYRRRPLPVDDRVRDVVDSFRALTFTS